MPTTAARFLTFSRALLFLTLLSVAVSPLTASSAAAKTNELQMHYLPYILTGSLDCAVISQTPVDGSSVSADEPISVAWTLRNLSDKTWRADSVDIRNTGGVSGTGKIFSLQYDVSPGRDYIFSMILAGQSASGTYSSNWGLYEGEISLCRFYVQFRVP